MSAIELNLSPGYVSGFYFVVLELIVIALIDISLIHITSALWYRRIINGIPVEVKAAEIPGIATSLVGSYVSVPNIIAYIIKAVLLACILLVDLKLNSVPKVPLTYQTVSGRFSYDPSDAIWEIRNDHLIVSRPFGKMRSCRNVNTTNNTMEIYSITFSFEGNESVGANLPSPGVQPSYPNESTIQCMAEGLVDDSEIYRIVSVVGCSQLVETNCSSQNQYQLPQKVELIPNQTVKYPADLFVDEPREYIRFQLEEYSAENAAKWWPDYDQPSLSCMRSTYGIPSNQSDTPLDESAFESCLVIAKSGNNTLIERWEYERNTNAFVRYFPGPIFEGDINIGNAQKVSILREFPGKHPSWESFSSQIVAIGSVYRSIAFTTIVVRGTPTTWTSIPTYIVTIVITLVVVSIIVRIVTRFTLENDERPRINTIDGLSSVAREEGSPSGRSLVGGRHITLGFVKADQNEGRFGPINPNSQAASRSSFSKVV